MSDEKKRGGERGGTGLADRPTPTVTPQPQPTTARPTTWNVMVRHSSFLLKQATVEASTADEARDKFLKLVEAKHAEKAGRQKQDEEGRKAAVRVREAFQHGLKADRNGDLEWIIQPQDDVDALRKGLKEQRERIWGPAGKVPA